VAAAGPVSPQERTRQTERTLLGGDPLALVSGELLRTVRVPFCRSSPTAFPVASIPLSPRERHGDWNYTLRPTRDTPEPG
jgi:hypothetical protein